MTGLLQCDDLMQFQRLLKRNVWFNTFDVLFDFRALKQLRAIDDKIIYALNVSTPTASMQVVNYIDAPFNISYFASILSGSRSWSETKMLGIENWAPTKLQGLYIDWLAALIDCSLSPRSEKNISGTVSLSWKTRWELSRKRCFGLYRTGFTFFSQ